MGGVTCPWRIVMGLGDRHSEAKVMGDGEGRGGSQWVTAGGGGSSHDSDDGEGDDRDEG